MARAGKLSLDDLVAQLRQLHGDALQAVVLYGSSAGGPVAAGASDHNVMVITDTLPIATLQALGQTMRAWQEAGNPPVLGLTTAEWRTSADIFPMEYADILERHRVLYGTLPLEGIAVRLDDLRLQLEHEAMGKLLRLRRAVMTAGTDRKRQEELLRASLSTLLVLFRAALRLAGVEVPKEPAQVIRAAAATCRFDPGPFLQVVALRSGSPPAGSDGSATGTVLSGYIEGVAALVTWLDGFQPTDQRISS